MTHKLIHLFVLFVVICSLFTQIHCDVKNKKSIRQNRLRFYQAPDWWRALVYSANSNQYKNVDRHSDKSNSKEANLAFARKVKSSDKSPTDVLSTSDSRMDDLDEFEPVGATDFELINFWPSLTKREDDYGHLR